MRVWNLPYNFHRIDQLFKIEEGTQGFLTKTLTCTRICVALHDVKATPWKAALGAARRFDKRCPNYDLKNLDAHLRTRGTQIMIFKSPFKNKGRAFAVSKAYHWQYSRYDIFMYLGIFKFQYSFLHVQIFSMIFYNAIFYLQKLVLKIMIKNIFTFQKFLEGFFKACSDEFHQHFFEKSNWAKRVPHLC